MKNAKLFGLRFLHAPRFFGGLALTLGGLFAGEILFFSFGWLVQAHGTLLTRKGSGEKTYCGLISSDVDGTCGCVGGRTSSEGGAGGAGGAGGGCPSSLAMVSRATWAAPPVGDTSRYFLNQRTACSLLPL